MVLPAGCPRSVEAIAGNCGRKVKVPPVPWGPGGGGGGGGVVGGYK